MNVTDIMNQAKGELHAIEQFRESHDKTHKDFILRGEVHKILNNIQEKLIEVKDMTEEELMDELVYRLQKDGVTGLTKPYNDITLNLEITEKEVQKMSDEKETTETEDSEPAPEEATTDDVGKDTEEVESEEAEESEEEESKDADESDETSE